MKSLFTGTASGCVVWVLVFGLLSMCLCPTMVMIGGVTSAGPAAGIIGAYLCPAGSTPEVITFSSTTRDEYGNEQPSTGYEMQCVAAGGEIVRAPSPDYAFYWIGALAAGSLLIAALLGLLLAAPVGGLIARWMARRT
jgi:hypothetical protein